MRSANETDLDRDRSPPPLSRPIRVDEIKEGEERLIEANEAERETIAALLDLQRLDRLSLDFRFARRGQGRFALNGRLLAEVTQTCVVTLEPVDAVLDIPIDIEFWPAGQIEAYADTADEAARHGILDWPEPIVDGKIDLCPIIYQSLATGLDPYPKREGTSFSWPETNAETSGNEDQKGPFAALARLKPGR